MTIIPLYLMCFLQCLKQCAYHKNVVGISTVGASAVRNVGVIYTGIEQDGLQCCGKFLGSVVLYNAFKLCHVVSGSHGSVLLSVWFCFGKLDGKLAFVALAAQFGAAVFKPCLYLLHAEKLAAHVPLSFPVAERLGIIAYQAIERVHGLSESLAVVVAAHPLFATQTEQTAVIHYQLAIGDADKERINLNAETGVKPLSKTHGYAVIGTPSTLLILGGVSFSDYYQIFGSNRSDRTYVLSLINFICEGLQIIFHVLLFQPVFREFPEWSCHSGKVYPTVLNLAFNSQFFAVHLDEFNQILIDVHIYKNCDIKEKPSVGVNVTYYDGRMKSPIVSARPP